MERRAIAEAEEMGLTYRVIHCGPQNVKGIEINPFAAELAGTSIWIGIRRKPSDQPTADVTRNG